MNKIIVKNIFGHLKNIIIHKFWVLYYAHRFGITWQGIVHDLSKFSPIEFFESVKYYKGSSSPITECKSKNFISYAWQHHKGRNPHHYEYWVDYFDSGNPVPHKIPYKYVMEMLADWFAAGRTYAMNAGIKWNDRMEYDWWQDRKQKFPYMMVHPMTLLFIDKFMEEVKFFYGTEWVKDKHNRTVLKNRLKDYYKAEYKTFEIV